ncbi:hypothetical protein [Streptomyces sp. NPDC048521]|uniref:hypothetical protein n=1 Tax=Streptomyces sp. NPDC048521 TaxID=3365566 RepID=UPI00371E3D73
MDHDSELGLLDPAAREPYENGYEVAGIVVADLPRRPRPGALPRHGGNGLVLRRGPCAAREPESPRRAGANPGPYGKDPMSTSTPRRRLHLRRA